MFQTDIFVIVFRTFLSYLIKCLILFGFWVMPSVTFLSTDYLNYA